MMLIYGHHSHAHHANFLLNVAIKINVIQHRALVSLYNNVYDKVAHH